jgi:hypothetical protein
MVISGKIRRVPNLRGPGSCHMYSVAELARYIADAMSAESADAA